MKSLMSFVFILKPLTGYKEPLLSLGLGTAFLVSISKLTLSKSRPFIGNVSVKPFL